MRTETIQLPSSFFEPEVRCGYHVSAERKKIWAVELDLLAKFSEVCERNGLSYFLDGGTLLGAIRHKGFIPWDDDADVIMPRNDYTRLCQIAADEFLHPYFFQNTYVEQDFYRGHGQLRNSNTTGCVDVDEGKDINRGIAIDIFVLDNIPDSMLQRAWLKRRSDIAKKRMDLYCDNYDYHVLSGLDVLRYRYAKLFFKVVPLKRYFKHFEEKLIGRYRNKRTRIVGDITLSWRGYVQWPSSWYDGYYYLPFETLRLRAPLFYHEIMAVQYGDYMRIPDNVDDPNGRYHGSVIFDPETPYEQFFAEQRKVARESS